jgi:hypothetical protein
MDCNKAAGINMPSFLASLPTAKDLDANTKADDELS